MLELFNLYNSSSVVILYTTDKLSLYWSSSKGAQLLSDRVLDSRPRGCGFEPHRRHCVVSFSKYINSSLVLVQPRKTCAFITEILLLERKESNKTNKTVVPQHLSSYYTP